MTRSGQHLDRDHPISAVLARLEADLASVGQAPAWSLSGQETRAALLALTRIQSRLTGLEVKVAAHAHRTGAADAVGATSIAAWLAHETRMTGAEAQRMVKHAVAVDERHERVEEGLVAGDLRPDQARVIVEAVDSLPHDVDADVLSLARIHLVAEAAHHDAKALRILGKRVLDVVAPEVGEAQLAKELDAEERAAEATQRLTMSDDGRGRTYGRFTLPTWKADLMRKILQALASPRHGGPGATPEGMGKAFGAFIERFPTDRVPDAGGVPATVVVTMDHETLLGGLRAAQLDTGTMISPGLARRLACRAGVIPVVLGGESQVLDVGRKRRLHSETQRLALAARDRGCTAVGCDRPPAWCEAHHDTPWSQGGGTSVQDGRLLCSRHHHLAHHPSYEVTHHPGRKVSFARRE